MAKVISSEKRQIVMPDCSVEQKQNLKGQKLLLLILKCMRLLGLLPVSIKQSAKNNGQLHFDIKYSCLMVLYTAVLNIVGSLCFYLSIGYVYAIVTGESFWNGYKILSPQFLESKIKFTTTDLFLNYMVIAAPCIFYIGINHSGK